MKIPYWMRRPTNDATKAFVKFHDENPHVYAEIRRRALEAYNDGSTRVGIAQIFEAMRFDSSFQTQGEQFKLSNNHKPFYSRLLIYNHPKLAQIIKTHRQFAYGS